MMKNFQMKIIKTSLTILRSVALIANAYANSFMASLSIDSIGPKQFSSFEQQKMQRGQTIWNKTSQNTSIYCPSQTARIAVPTRASFTTTNRSTARITSLTHTLANTHALMTNIQTQPMAPGVPPLPVATAVVPRSSLQATPITLAVAQVPQAITPNPASGISPPTVAMPTAKPLTTATQFAPVTTPSTKKLLAIKLARQAVTALVAATTEAVTIAPLLAPNQATEYTIQHSAYSRSY